MIHPKTVVAIQREVVETAIPLVEIPDIRFMGRRVFVESQPTGRDEQVVKRFLSLWDIMMEQPR